MNGYLIDSNILINSNRYYRQEFFPIVWKFFITTPNFYMLDRVYDELTTKDDALSVWTKQNYNKKAILAANSIQEYTQVSSFLSESGLWTPAGYQDWTEKYEKADPWLIACAMKNSYTIITDEKNAGPNGVASNNEPKIPFVANHFEVKINNFWDFLGAEHFIANLFPITFHPHSGWLFVLH